LPLSEFHGLRGDAEDGTAESERYSELLAPNPPDFAVLVIGENVIWPSIDPPLRFDDPQQVKVVELDEVCRAQQVNDVRSHD